MALLDWLSESPQGDLPEPLSSFVDELTRMLDEYRPTKLARDRSYLRRTDEGALELKLAHAEEETADVAVDVSPTEATVSWFLSHEHVYPDDRVAEERRPWTGLVVDLLAQTLRGAVIFETVERGNSWVRTRTIFLNADGEEEVFSVNGSLLAWLLRWKPERTTRQRLEYGVRDLPTAWQVPDSP